MLDTKHSDEEHSHEDHGVKNWDLHVGRVVVGKARLLNQWLIRVWEQFFDQEETSDKECANETDEGNLDGRHKAAIIKLLDCSDLTLRQIETIIIVSVSEVVNVVSDHGVLTVIDGSHSWSLASAREVRL